MHGDLINKAVDKAKQLRTLTDELFEQTSVEGAAEVSGFELVSGAELLNQLLDEECFELRAEGFQVQAPLLSGTSMISVRITDILRVFSNIFSNIRKHGDIEVPVIITASESEDQITVHFFNSFTQIRVAPDCHGIGVPTMTRLIASNGGELSISMCGNLYETKISFLKAKSPSHT